MLLAKEQPQINHIYRWIKRLPVISGTALLLSCTSQALPPQNTADSLVESALTSHPHVSPGTHIPVMLAPLSQWQSRVFNGETQYQLVEAAHPPTIQASSQSSASMLYQELSIDLNKTPFLHWQWKVDNIFSQIDEKTKGGDDYPARIYIAVRGKTGSIFPRAINYVWASASPKGSQWLSPYSQHIAIVAQQSGQPTHQRWVSEKVNLKADLQRYFKEDFDKIKGIAIMTDSDDSQQQASAAYRNIFFSPAP